MSSVKQKHEIYDGDIATAQQARDLLETQQYKCALTGEELTPSDAALDHIVPVSKGGDSSIENLQWVTEPVNKCNGVLSQNEFIDLCRKVTAHEKQQG